MQDLKLTGGLIFSPILLNALVEKGAVREQAYRWVQRNAMKRWLEGEDFLDNLKKDEDIAAVMTNEEIEECFCRQETKSFRMLSRSTHLQTEFIPPIL